MGRNRLMNRENVYIKIINPLKIMRIGGLFYIFILIYIKILSFELNRRVKDNLRGE